MVKKLSTIALVGLLALPATGFAATGSDDLEEKVDALSVIQLSGDFRSRMDYYDADTILGPSLTNDTTLTNRFRLNIRAKATENVEFKGRLAMYKTWGMPSTPNYSAIDGDVTRQPNDAGLNVDRAFMNWNAIGGMPLWFSIGRRPTTDGLPNHLRMGQDKRMATPTAFMDWPFDGISIGYAYSDTGRIRFCWGRGYEAGLSYNDAATVIADTDFAGLSWDILKQGDKLIYAQSFMAFNVFNFPQDYYDQYKTAYAAFFPSGRQNVGDLLHTSGVYMDKVNDINYFVSVGWSMTQPRDNGMFNDSMNTPGVANTSSENGYSVHVGGRYDLDDMGIKIGAEVNYGSEYWVAMTPGHDDLYQSKLATRGMVYELYMIYDLPSGEAVSKFGKAFMRLGFQVYNYDYTGSGDWNTKPYDVDSVSATNLATAYAGVGSYLVKDATQAYLTFEMTF
jgi:hypothetical protein